jgi:hypothetical protein
VADEHGTIAAYELTRRLLPKRLPCFGVVSFLASFAFPAHNRSFHYNAGQAQHGIRLVIDGCEARLPLCGFPSELLRAVASIIVTAPKTNSP